MNKLKMWFKYDGALLHDDNQYYIQFQNIQIPITIACTTISNTTHYVYMDIKENEWTFYYFNTYALLELFKQILKVNGFGMKLSAKLCATLDYECLVDAIVSKDVAILKSIQGISQRLALTLVNTLSDKVSLKYSTNEYIKQALAVLQSLGISSALAQNYLSKHNPSEYDQFESYLSDVLKEIQV